MISAGGSEHVYRSVDEVPAPLRTQLLKCTNGGNSATILIADRRGRAEIARAMRNLPGAAQRRLMRAMLGQEDAAAVTGWLTPARRKALFVVVAVILMAALAFALSKIT
jgi:hypothetical protein